MSPAPLNIFICQSISGTGEWLKSQYVTWPWSMRHEGVNKEPWLPGRALPQCFWNLHRYSLAHEIALKFSSDLKYPVGASGFPHTPEVKWWATETAEASIPGGGKHKAGTVSDSWINQQILTECLLCAKHKAGEGPVSNGFADKRQSLQQRGAPMSPADGSAHVPPRQAVPRCWSRATPHVWQHGIARWLPNICHPTFPVELI